IRLPLPPPPALIYPRPAPHPPCPPPSFLPSSSSPLPTCCCLLLLLLLLHIPIFSNSSHSLSLLLAFGDPCLPSSKQPGVQTRSNNISTAVSCSSLHQQHPPPPPRTVPRPEAHTRTRTRQCPAQQQPVDEQHHSDALTLAINPCPPARRGFFFTHIHHPPPPVDPRRSGKLSPLTSTLPPPPRRKPSLGCRPPQWLPSPASRLPPRRGASAEPDEPQEQAERRRSPKQRQAQGRAPRRRRRLGKRRPRPLRQALQGHHHRLASQGRPAQARLLLCPHQSRRSSTPAASASTSARLPLKHSSTPRRTLQPKSPAARLNTAITKSSPVSAPAGRSPTRGKRSGILSSRRRSGPYARVDPPSFSLGNPSSAAPFSLDAALKGTLSSYVPPAASASSARVAKPAARPSSSLLDEPEAKASCTCVLDISSDEESERKASRERDEGRDKENVPPPDDVSQTRSTGAGTRQATRPLCADDMVVEKERVALGEMNAVDFYADGCDESSVVLVHEDDEQEPPSQNFAFAPDLKALGADADAAADETEPESEFVEGDAVTEVAALMGATTKGSSKAAVLQPMDGTGESFELWESGSAKDDGEGEATAIAAS
ncbi:hypothetical protein ACCO45_007529, partial [Purpureocillium lilacinum]